jgi:hypothetical protein
VPQALAHDGDAVRVFPEIQLGGEVPELMRRDPNADIAACALGDGRRQHLALDVSTIAVRKQPYHAMTTPAVLPVGQVLLEQPGGFGQQRV